MPAAYGEVSQFRDREVRMERRTGHEPPRAPYSGADEAKFEHVADSIETGRRRKM